MNEGVGNRRKRADRRRLGLQGDHRLGLGDRFGLEGNGLGFGLDDDRLGLGLRLRLSRGLDDDRLSLGLRLRRGLDDIRLGLGGQKGQTADRQGFPSGR